MPYENYECLSVRLDRGVANVSIDHPPMNLFDLPLMREMSRLGGELAEDDDVRVAVFRSADPDFFIAHADVELILQLPTEARPKASELSFFHAMVERYRTLPKATIGVIEGIARGGGSEFLLSLDMRFAAIGRAVVGQPEVALGILPGGSGTQRLHRLMGRGRALEAVLGCADFDAELAERYGWVNRALAPDEIGTFVEDLARRIASFPPEAVALAKRALDAVADPREGLLEEAHCFDRSLASDAAQQRMKRFLENGGQTRAGEREIDRLYAALTSDPPA